MSLFGDILGGFLGLGSSFLRHEASKEAAEKQYAMDAATRQMYERLYGAQWWKQLPYRRAGETTTNALLNLLGAGPGKFEESPGYQFRFQEGLRGITNALASRGLLQSGRALKEITRYGQGLASQEYQNWLNRYYQKMEPLLALSVLGQRAASLASEPTVSSLRNIANLSPTEFEAISQAEARSNALIPSRPTGPAPGTEGGGYNVLPIPPAPSLVPRKPRTLKDIVLASEAARRQPVPTQPGAVAEFIERKPSGTFVYRRPGRPGVWKRGAGGRWVPWTRESPR